MKQKNLHFYTLLGILLLFSCKTSRNLIPEKLAFPTPVDTKSRPVEYQVKKVFDTQTGVFFSNNFDAARLNEVKNTAENEFDILISPENFPINPSPWYAFKVWSKENKAIKLNFKYVNAKHRYAPKMSKNGKDWTLIDTSFIQKIANNSIALTLKVSSDTLWVAGQEVVSSQDFYRWFDHFKTHKAVKTRIFAQSKLGRPMWMMDIGLGKTKKKPIIVILSRQHPPEVTGQFAMQRFLERILQENDALSTDFLNKYRLLVFPLLNPDGVDLGHWRHSTGGIDLNRDWAVFNQPETKNVNDEVIKLSKAAKGKVILGLDFHSTFEDVYYTFDDDSQTALPNFSKDWLAYMAKNIPNYKPNIEPSGLGQPVSKGWFYAQFRAVGITYEIGDNTPRDFIALKGKVSSEGMMKILLNRN